MANIHEIVKENEKLKRQNKSLHERLTIQALEKEEDRSALNVYLKVFSGILITRDNIEDARKTWASIAKDIFLCERRDGRSLWETYDLPDRDISIEEIENGKLG